MPTTTKHGFTIYEKGSDYQCHGPCGGEWGRKMVQVGKYRMCIECLKAYVKALEEF